MRHIGNNLLQLFLLFFLWKSIFIDYSGSIISLCISGLLFLLLFLAYSYDVVKWGIIKFNVKESNATWRPEIFNLNNQTIQNRIEVISNKIKASGKANLLFILSIIFIVGVLFFPYFYNGENTHLTIHDNLDSNLVWAKLFPTNDLFSFDYIIEAPLGGLPRSSILGSYDLSIIWFKLFGVYYGYVANKIIITIVAFYGMFHLLKDYILPKNTNDIVSFISAFLFCALPFWSFNIGVAGIPLVIYSFLNLLYKKNLRFSWIVIVVYPFYSSLIFSGLFLAIVLAGLGIRNWYNKKKFPLHFFYGLCTLSILYTVSHIPLFVTFILDQNHISHRTEFKLTNLNLEGVYDKAEHLFKHGQYHTHSIHYAMVPFIVIALLLQLIKKKIIPIFMYSALAILLITAFYGLISWGSLSPYIDAMMDVIPIQLQRFHVFYPLLWYILLAISFFVFIKHLKYGYLIMIIIFSVHFNNLWLEKETNSKNNEPTFRAFYSEELFSEIDSYIGQEKATYKVMSIGMEPAISLYNGFYTLDGYFPDYPLSHKHKFRTIIAQELAKNEGNRKYFDEYGSRCYAFCDELGTATLILKTDTIKHLDINTEVFVSMGGRYLFSAVYIENANENDLVLKKIFSHPEAYCDVYLYKALSR